MRFIGTGSERCLRIGRHDIYRSRYNALEVTVYSKPRNGGKVRVKVRVRDIPLTPFIIAITVPILILAMRWLT